MNEYDDRYSFLGKSASSTCLNIATIFAMFSSIFGVTYWIFPIKILLVLSLIFFVLFAVVFDILLENILDIQEHKMHQNEKIIKLLSKIAAK